MAGPSGIGSYSTNANINATVDGGAVTWAENQPPSSVNNSVRQNLADIRLAFNDLAWFSYGSGDQATGTSYLGVPYTYASATSVTVAGANVAPVHEPGRRMRFVGATTGTIYGSIASSSYASATNTTTINLTFDSGSLANEALTGSLSQIPVTGKPISMASLGGTGSLSVSPQLVVTSSLANAVAVGPTGLTNPTFQIDASGGGATSAGLKISSFVSPGISAEIQAVATDGVCTLNLDAGVSGGILQFGRNSSAACSAYFRVPIINTSTSALALTIGAGGTTNPRFTVDSSGSFTSGISISANVSSAQAQITAIGPSGGTNLMLEAGGGAGAAVYVGYNTAAGCVLGHNVRMYAYGAGAASFDPSGNVLTGTLPVNYGGTGATTIAGIQSALGLGTAAYQNTGTTGHNLPFLDGINNWTGAQTITTAQALWAGISNAPANYAGAQYTNDAGSKLTILQGGSAMGGAFLGVSQNNAGQIYQQTGALMIGTLGGYNLTLGANNIAMMTFNSGGTIITSPATISLSQGAGGTNLGFAATNNAASGYAYTNVTNDIGRNATMGIFGSGYGGTVLGQPLANNATFYTAGSGGGIIIGTVGGNSMYLGTNNVTQMQFTGGGGITIPPAVAGGDKGAGSLNVQSFYINGGQLLAAAVQIGHPTVNTNLSVAHGLAAFPNTVSFFVVCNTAEGGFLVNDRVPIYSGITAAAANGLSCWYNGTNVGAHISGQVFLISAGTSTSFLITPANWTLWAWVSTF